MANEYVFIDEWDVDAPQEAVFNALVDARTYPEWWKPVYIEVEADGPPEPGCVSKQEFKGRLPYHLNTTSEVKRMEAPNEFEVEVVGDLTGKGVWTLTPRDGKVHVHFDWRVIADRPAPSRPDPDPAPRLPLEPQLVDQARDRGPRAIRALARRVRRAAAPAALALAACALAPATASAEISCAVQEAGAAGPPGNVLAISATTADFDVVAVTRNGDEIVVSNDAMGAAGGAAPAARRP